VKRLQILGQDDHLSLDRCSAPLAVSHVPPPNGNVVGRSSPFVEWGDFWSKDRREAEWLFEPILAFGRGHAIYAAKKTGKSLVMLWIAATLTQRDDVVVVYLDYEMGEDDLFERLDDMGFGPTSDLSRLRYALLPALRPLDTAAGADDLFALVDAARVSYPDCHVVVVLDTYGRVVEGEENSNDTTRAFHQHTGMGLKRRRVTWARLDHEGKNPDRGQRGASAKGDDVDVIWRLARAEGGYVLRCEAKRVGWVPEKVGLIRLADPLRFGIAEETWPAGTREAVDALDRLGVPLDYGQRRARPILVEADESMGTDVLNAALRYRRQRAEGRPE
jgi:hypothetical protein